PRGMCRSALLACAGYTYTSAMETKVPTKPLRLVIVDGHERARLALVKRLQRIPQVTVLAAVDAVSLALNAIRDLMPDAVLLEPKTVGERSPAAVSRLAGTGSPIVVV